LKYKSQDANDPITVGKHAFRWVYLRIGGRRRGEGREAVLSPEQEVRIAQGLLHAARYARYAYPYFAQRRVICPKNPDHNTDHKCTYCS
jgi:hypothetical protein